MLLFIGRVAFSTSEPAGHDVVSGFVSIAWRDSPEGFSGDIKLTETECSRGKIQLIIEDLRLELRDLRPPGDGFRAVFLLRDFRQNMIGGQRVAVDLEGVVGGMVCSL